MSKNKYRTEFPKERAFEIDEEILKGMPSDQAKLIKTTFELLSQSDRGAAIIGGAFVEAKLKIALESRLIDGKYKNNHTLFNRIFDFEGPLGSFSAKIDMCYSLQIIGKHTFDDLHKIREIRNKFAHSLEEEESIHRPITFSTQVVASRCNNLWLPKNHPQFLEAKDNNLSDWYRLDTNRGTYIFTIILISNLMEIVAKFYKNSKLSIPDTLL